MGIVYLIHFSKPLHHAKHYIGYTNDRLEERIQEHRSNRGAKILTYLNSVNIEWEVVRTWEGPDIDKHFERRLKNRCKSLTYCPICREQKLKRSAEVKRKWRRKRREPDLC